MKLFLDFTLFSIGSDFNHFAEANVFLLIIRNAAQVTLGLSEFFDEKMRVIIREIMKENRSELRLLESQVAKRVSGPSVFPREMTVISDFHLIPKLPSEYPTSLRFQEMSPIPLRENHLFLKVEFSVNPPDIF